MSDKVATSVTLAQKNREYLDREVNNRSAFINDLIEAHRTGKSDMEEAIARHRREQLESELRTVELRKDAIQDELEHVTEIITEENERIEGTLIDARETLADAPRDPDNPAIKRWAKKVNMRPAELIEELDK